MRNLNGNRLRNFPRERAFVHVLNLFFCFHLTAKLFIAIAGSLSFFLDVTLVKRFWKGVVEIFRHNK